MSINSIEDVVVDYIHQLRDNLREAKAEIKRWANQGAPMGEDPMVVERHPSHADLQNEVEKLKTICRKQEEDRKELEGLIEQQKTLYATSFNRERDLHEEIRKLREHNSTLVSRHNETAARVVHKYTSMVSFISEASVWHLQTFGEAAFKDKRERAARLIEEALETGQALGLDAYVMHKLVDHVMAKPPGFINQEMSGVIVCWALLCGSLSGVNPDKIMQDALDDCWKRQAEIKAKHQSKIAKGVSGSALWLHEGNATKVEPLVGVGPAEWDTKVESRTETRSMHIDGSKIIAEGRKAHDAFINETRQPGRGEEIDRGTM